MLSSLCRNNDKEVRKGKGMGLFPFFLIVEIGIFVGYAYTNSYFVAGVLTKNDFVCGMNFCGNVLCPILENCPEESVIKNGSLCGCCDICVTYLNEDESCLHEGAKHPKVLHRICKKGFTCKNGKCSRQSSTITCEDQVKWRKSLKDDKNNIFSDELWIPECDESGNYRQKQCKRKKCLCYDEDGRPLFGQEERELADTMTCGCSRRMAQLQGILQSNWMTKPQEHCDKKGDYNELQCTGDICYCSNTTTGEVIGRVTKMELRELLPCFESKQRAEYKTQCELQLTRTRSLRYQFHRKNIDVIGLEYVNCDNDGNFAAKQCMTDRCVCVDRKGVGIKSYSVERSKTHLELEMKCNCARDEYDISAIHAHYRRMVCDAGGNFQPVQCFNKDYCFCVDEDGDIISKQLTATDIIAQNRTCLSLRQCLQTPGIGSC